MSWLRSQEDFGLARKRNIENSYTCAIVYSLRASFLPMAKSKEVLVKVKGGFLKLLDFADYANCFESNSTYIKHHQ